MVGTFLTIYLGSSLTLEIYSYDSLQDRVKDAFAGSSNSHVLSAASNVFHIVLQDPNRSVWSNSMSTLATVEESGSGIVAGRTQREALDELNMGGLCAAFQFIAASKVNATAQVATWIAELVRQITE
jgi:hypothetical protein